MERGIQVQRYNLLVRQVMSCLTAMDNTKESRVIAPAHNQAGCLTASVKVRREHSYRVHLYNLIVDTQSKAIHGLCTLHSQSQLATLIHNNLNIPYSL